MTVYALILTFCFGTLVGVYLTFLIILKIDKKEKAHELDVASKQAVNLNDSGVKAEIIPVGPNPFTK